MTKFESEAYKSLREAKERAKSMKKPHPESNKSLHKIRMDRANKEREKKFMKEHGSKYSKEELEKAHSHMKYHGG